MISWLGTGAASTLQFMRIRSVGPLLAKVVRQGHIVFIVFIEEEIAKLVEKPNHCEVKRLYKKISP